MTTNGPSTPPPHRVPAPLTATTAEIAPQLPKRRGPSIPTTDTSAGARRREGLLQQAIFVRDGHAFRFPAGAYGSTGPRKSVVRCTPRYFLMPANTPSAACADDDQCGRSTSGNGSYVGPAIPYTPQPGRARGQDRAVVCGRPTACDGVLRRRNTHAFRRPANPCRERRGTLNSIRSTLAQRYLPVRHHSGRIQSASAALAMREDDAPPWPKALDPLFDREIPEGT